jgi:NADH-quinone oxidoreductase subunit G
MPLVRIDRREIEVDEGTTIMQAADALGIFIPRYCYHPGLSIAGCCRICMVEVEGSPKLLTACSTPVEEDMIVRTDTEPVKEAQRSVMEFLLINHPLDCPVCDQAGECELQDYSYTYGFAESRFRERKVKQRKKDVGRDLLLYADRCIMCTRCVRFADEVSGQGEVGIFERGARTEIDVFPGIHIDDKLAGNIADICPVGAFLSKDFLFKRRVWELESTQSVCPACSVGCNVLIDHADGEIMRLRPRHNASINNHWMCDIGRMDYKLLKSGERLKNPLVRDGEFYDAVSMEEALARAGARLKEIAGSTGVVISSDATNEEAFAAVMLASALGAEKNVCLLPGAKGEREEFAGGFVIEEDRSPNAKGVSGVIDAFRAGSVGELADIDSRLGLDALCVICGPHSNPGSIERLAAMAARASFTVVLAALPSALTGAASVVLPIAGHAEKEGTYTNSGGIVQKISPAFAPPGEASDGVGIIAGLAEAMGIDLGFRTTREASAALAREISGYLSIDMLDDLSCGEGDDENADEDRIPQADGAGVSQGGRGA